MLTKFMLHGSNAVLVICSVAILVAAFLRPVGLSPVLVGAGALLFYATEYGTHRFLFHAQPSRGGWVRAKQHRLHYDHHLEPERLDLLFLPLWYVLPNLTTLGLVAFALLHSWSSVAAVLLGAMAALLHYEWVHLVAHVPYEPRTGLGRWIKRYHLRHHFVNERLWFGVSNPALDVVFNTYDSQGRPRSPTTRILYPQDQA